MTALRRDLRALALLTGALLRRLLREGLVLRSLTFPVVLTAGTLLLTLLVVAYIRARPVVALDAALATPELTATLQADGFRAEVLHDPLGAARAGDVWAGTDGETLVLTDPSVKALLFESRVRAATGATWRPDPKITLPAAPAAAAFGGAVGGLLAAVFGLYGVVFGAGTIARDRDGGTLEVEQSLGVGRWVHPAARWLAGSALLALYLGAGLALFEALLGLPDVWQMARHGSAAALGATGLGILAMARSGQRGAFSGPLAGALSVATGLFGLGYAAPAVGQYLPMASLVAGGGGYMPLAASVAIGAVAIAWFTRNG